MSSVDVSVVTRRLSAMRTLLEHLASLDVASAEQLEDLGIRLQVERVLTQVVNLAGEVNAHVATAVLDRPPSESREGFDRMAEAGFLRRATAEALRPSVGLRNILTHEYVRVDLEQVARAVPKALHDYRDYVRQVAEKLSSATA